MSVENEGFSDSGTGELGGRVSALARVPVLLVASDYDGTLSPIVDNPDDARPDRDAMIALRSLADLPNTHVALVSGRALKDLAELSQAPDHLHLVGSHGSEFDLDFADTLDPDAADLKLRIEESLTVLANEHPGCTVEVKPASVAFHYRNAEPSVGEAAVEKLRAGAASWDGVYVKSGKMVLELAVVSTSKGTALNVIRGRVGASAIAFLGDDVTDEDGFATLTGPDLGVKVGGGTTLAPFRVESTREVARLLARLCELRQAWMAGSDAVPIETHAMLTDQRTIAMVTPNARIVWMCAPRIDSGSLFAELLGGPAAGHFSVRPVGTATPLSQQYLGDSFHLRTVWPKVTVTDYLDCSGGRVTQRAGRTDLVRVIDGAGKIRIEFAPRLDFGRTHTHLRIVDDGLEVDDTVDPIVLRSPRVAWTLIDEGPHHTATAEVDLSELDGPLELELRYGTGSLGPAVIEQRKRSRVTERYWGTWATGLDLPDAVPDAARALMVRSALVIKGLCQGPTGAIAAAATTSLPESIGGVRNWDYRYCWPRDAALSGTALVRMGATDEALRLLDWLLGVVDDLPNPDRLSPIYTVAGGELPPEAEIAELSGYAGSRPVRVGNAASRQLQLDVFGPIVELVHSLLESGAPLSAEHWRLVDAMVGAVASRWSEPDHGIWEIRGPKRHHVHSKVMCWQAVALGVEIAERHHGRPRPDWIELRDAIAADVNANGFNTELQTFTGAYDETEIDASVLAVGLTGLIDPKDARFSGTIDAVEKALRTDNTVYRYKMDDGLPGAEGGFNICTTWLIESLAKNGRVDQAKSLFEAYCSLAGPTGLLAEEFDQETGLALGNHPQAYSHLGLVNAALALDAAGAWG
ncbi:MAG: trehalose-phosphatase [Planctomycetota bacterium]